MSRIFSRCLITGITGSLGSYLAEYIHNKSKKLKILGFYRSDGYKKKLQIENKKIKLFKLDLKNFKSIKTRLSQIKPDLIFHLASDADVRKSFDFPIENAINNNLITVNLLEAVRKLKINPVIIICSTSEVYGNVSKKDMPIDETQKIAPINPYAATKAYQDLISQVYQKSFKLKIIITRMFSYTNARRDNLFQTSFARQIAMCEIGKLRFVRHGNLKSIRTFVDIKDACSAYWLAATKGRIGEIYNIGGKKAISVKQFLNTLKKIAKKNIKSKLDTKLLRPQDLILQIPNSKKFISHTGWSTKVDFKSSVKKLLEECREKVNKSFSN
jgi:GDP-4-dehydro-6-deoxy-D-mannose reductase